MTTHRKINLDHTPQSPENKKKTLDDLCEEYKDMFSLHQGDIGHTKLLAMDIDIGDYLLIVKKKIHLLPLKHTQWVQEKLKIFRKLGIFHKVFLLG